MPRRPRSAPAARRSSSASSVASCPRRACSCSSTPSGVTDASTLRIGGSGPLLDDLRERAAAAGVARPRRTRRPGRSRRRRRLLPGLDVLAVPSLPTPSWTEQFGRVAVEAMACGVPVVSSDAGALPDVVGGAGIVVPAGDASALAGALVEAGGIRAPPSSGRAGSRAPRSAAGRPWAATTSSCTDRSCTRHPPRCPASRSSSSPTAHPSCCAGRSSRWRGCPSPSSTTRRCPRSPRSAPSWACATSTPAATAASRRASTSGSQTGSCPAPTCCC